jgi:AcrR family transcriptional regulator
MTAGHSSRQDWSAAGLAILRDGGVEALTVERLCRNLGRTKGSFYHHFGRFDDFLEALLARWEMEQTDAPIRAEGDGGPADRLARLEDAVRMRDRDLGRAIRAWALRDARARVALERVDRRRLDHLTGLFRAAGYGQPASIADLACAFVVGTGEIGPALAPDRSERRAEALSSVLAWLGRRSDDPDSPGGS